MDRLLSRHLLARECVLGVWKEVSFPARHVDTSLVLGASHLEWICAVRPGEFILGRIHELCDVSGVRFPIVSLLAP